MIFELWAWLLVILLSALGVIGNLTLFELGKQGLEAVVSRFPRIEPARWKRAGELFETRGSWILLLSFLPGLGLLLSTAAGAFGVRLYQFLLWVMVAKMVRNWLLLIIAVNVYDLVLG
ncbi:MAG TPA: VTT domain-containing protein [Anaerolineae bacterium]|nr:VTT domain-containing protein [Anaerolineae bacterium]